MLWTVALAFPLAAVGVLAITPLVMRFARRMDWVAYPRADRWHGQPTALMGGIAIYIAATLGVLIVLPVQDVWPLWTGATLMFIVGMVDDLAQIQPAAKLAAQVVATGLLLYAGYTFGMHWPLWLSLPLTLLWVIGITNAVNLLDNMDGLAGGIAGIAALVITIFAGLVGSPTAVALGSAVAGAALGFLAFNFKPARIFMGDCGSLFLGFSIAALALVVQQQADGVGQLAVGLVPLSVLAVPILDTTLVTFMRKLAGRPVSQGGRDHTSHRLVFLGLSEKHAVLTLYGLSLCSGALALVVLFVDVKLFYALSVFVGAALGVFGVHLARANVYQTGEASGDGAPSAPFRPSRPSTTRLGTGGKPRRGFSRMFFSWGRPSSWLTISGLRKDSGSSGKPKWWRPFPWWWRPRSSSSTPWGCIEASGGTPALRSSCVRWARPSWPEAPPLACTLFSMAWRRFRCRCSSSTG